MSDPTGEQFGPRLFSILGAVILWVVCIWLYNSLEQTSDLLKLQSLMSMSASAFPAMVVGLFLYWASFTEAGLIRWLGLPPALYTSLLGGIGLIVWVYRAITAGAQ